MSHDIEREPVFVHLRHAAEELEQKSHRAGESCESGEKGSGAMSGKARKRALLRDLEDHMQWLLAAIPSRTGGWPRNMRLQRAEIIGENDRKIVAELVISLEECGAACCSGDEFELVRTIFARLEISKKDWRPSLTLSDG
jgi:hypothetical protein